MYSKWVGIEKGKLGHRWEEQWGKGMGGACAPPSKMMEWIRRWCKARHYSSVLSRAYSCVPAAARGACDRTDARASDGIVVDAGNERPTSSFTGD